MEAHAMEVIVNGEARAVRQNETVLSLLQTLGLDPARVAVELDREIVKQPEWSRTIVAPGSRLEIVQFVGGG